MTDATLAMILQMRSQGRRIDNVTSLFGGAATGRRSIRGQANSPAVIGQLRGRTTTVTQEIQFDFTVRVGPQAPPAKLTAIVRQAGGNTTTVTYRSW